MNEMQFSLLISYDETVNFFFVRKNHVSCYIYENKFLYVVAKLKDLNKK